MQTRRDQLQAYKFLIRRILASLLGNVPESPEQPMRRVMISTFSGVMIGVVACAGVGLYGWLSGKSARAWKEETGILIVEKETGTRYIYRSEQGVLNPIVNYASARLLIGGDVKIKRISRKSLADTPRGPALGILGAPDALPDKKDIVSEPWAVCSEEVSADQGTTPEVDVLVGRKDLGATNLGDRGVVVAGGDSTLWFVWGGERHETDNKALRTMLFGPGAQSTVGPAWLNAVPEGQPLLPLTIGGRGENGQQVDGQATEVGQVFETRAVNNEKAFYVMQRDGLSQVSEVQANLMLGADVIFQPDDSGKATEVPLNAVNTAPQSSIKVDDQGLPRSIPDQVDLAGGAGTVVCAWYDKSSEPIRVTTGGEIPDPAPGTESNAGVPSALTAEHVAVPSGKAAIVALQTGDGQPPSAYYLVTDAGVKFPMPSEAVLDKLGYGGVKPVQVPPSILRLVPQGPALNEEDAGRPAPIAPQPAPEK